MSSDPTPDYSQVPAPTDLLLDTAPEAAFDRFTELTSLIFDVPVSLISIPDENRQFFKSAIGLQEPYAAKRETPINLSFCQYVVRDRKLLAISDARVHELVRDNPAVSQLGVRAYAGAPIVDVNGVTFGALCAVDSKPREWSERDLHILSTMAHQVSREVAMRQVLANMGVNLVKMDEHMELLGVD